MLAIKSCPVDIPPEVPPEELDLKPSGDISSLLSDPFASMTENPAPISTPLTAFIPIRALAISLSSLSKTGSPNPGGKFVTFTVIFAPIESPSSRSLLISFSISGIIFLSGLKKGFLSISLKSISLILICPI